LRQEVQEGFCQKSTVPRDLEAADARGLTALFVVFVLDDLDFFTFALGTIPSHFFSDTGTLSRT
jgi:hypothetical protein